MCILDSIYYESDGAVRTDLLILRTTDEQIASRDVWHAIQFLDPSRHHCVIRFISTFDPPPPSVIKRNIFPQKFHLR